MTISLCMIVKDEAEQLPLCLASVQGVVDEIVVLDTGSTDETIAIARAQGARVYEQAWSGDFALARNYVLQYVRGDWVLVLDADERLVPGVSLGWQDWLQDPDQLVINLVRQELGAKQSPYSLVSRLFRRHPLIHFTRPYHALIDETVLHLLQQEPHWQIGDFPQTAILHDGYQPTAITGKDKTNRARQAMAGYLGCHPEDPYACSKLGALYVSTGEVERGLKLLKRGLRAQTLNAPLRYELHFHLGIAYGLGGKVAVALDHYTQALKEPLLPQLKLGAYNNLGNLWLDQGSPDRARACYEDALKADPTFALGYYHLGMSLKALGCLPEAVTAYRQALQLDPQQPETHQNLGVVLYKLGYLSQAIVHFRQAIALYRLQNAPQAEQLRQGLRELGIELV
ncbi:tetratricopeptide repeat protein [Candidatus Cyanaurora vandensis]|uniref:tetratricopeptide repeat protein n=1 Tax=Candidatus Cyanaurora vandensis TaxID=2714958 RepID=UPI00257BD1CE|nr:tetratricopeptide repeat protein [Candidatus Cyanaurora vandensis]